MKVVVDSGGLCDGNGVLDDIGASGDDNNSMYCFYGNVCVYCLGTGYEC